MSVLTAARAAWRGRPGRRLAALEETAPVRLLVPPARGPETALERAIVETLTARGPQGVRPLVSLVARTIYRNELADGGWLVDLGMLGEGVFVTDVVRTLAAGHGVLWDVGGPAEATRSPRPAP